LGYLFYSIAYAFFEPDDPARNVPGGPVEPVRTPGQQGLPFFVFDQQVNIDHGREAADKIKEVLGQAGLGVSDVLRDAVQQSAEVSVHP
jgi:hypothetical protein